MFIEINKKRWKKAGAGLLAAALAVGAAGGYRVINPGEAKTISEDTAVNADAQTDWGLSFQEPGKPPAANSSASELSEYGDYYCGDSAEKVIYLTFDAGFENGYTEEILNVLKSEKVPAAFFLVGTYMEENPELLKRMEREGHIVGNHTMNHPDMSAIAEEDDFRRELEETEKVYKKVTGKKMQKFYRPPQGKFSRNNLKQAQKLGYTTVFWSLAYVDWYVDQQPAREEAFEKLIPRSHNGAVILLHSTSKTNAEILKELIQRWKEQGYTFGSLKDLTVAKS